MSVIPASATFPSFFVVVAVFSLVTIALVTNLSKALATVRPILQSPRVFVGAMHNLLDATQRYMKRHVDLFTPSKSLKRDGRTSHIVQNSLTALIHDYLIPEILLPRDLWKLFLYRHNSYISFWWSPVLVMAHVMRLLLIPAWVALVVVLVFCLVFLDLSFACCRTLSRLFFCR